MAKKLFHLNSSDRQAKYWACQAIIADNRVCERLEFAIWRLHQMSLVDEIDHGLIWENDRSYRRIVKTYRFLFETCKVFLTIEGRVPVHQQGVVHVSPHHRWWPVSAEVVSWLPEPVKVTFQDGRVSSFSLVVLKRAPAECGEEEVAGWVLEENNERCFRPSEECFGDYDPELDLVF